MQLSIIIVNYNVKYFVEQCLHSVAKAIKNINAEVFVVDNQSSDNSIAYLQPLFPWVQFIVNDANIGFGKANNLAIKKSKGEYVLLLNPDTLVTEDCFEQCISFFSTQPNCGAVGVKMIDGSGTFLPESKRAFPSPMVSFFKIVGLSSIFKKSRLFNKYALGYLNENEIHEVDVLAGAFMMIKRAAIDVCKGFDEDFFMYGEDIDLSYRIQQAGFKNYYLGNVNIIHFKGESTKKGSLNYVKLFYSAMSIFVNKHYKGSAATIFVMLLNIAIFFKAVTSLIKSFFVKIGMPLFDAALILLALNGTAFVWIQYVRNGVPFMQSTVNITLFSFTAIMLIAAVITGIYDNLYKPSKAFFASFAGIVTMIAVYALLPETLRFSRGVIVIGGFMAALFVYCSRYILLQLQLIPPSYQANYLPATIVVGNEKSFQQVSHVYKQTGTNDSIIGRIGNNKNEKNTIGEINNLQEIIKELAVNEIVFCLDEWSLTHVIHWIQQHNSIHFRFFASNSKSIVGSDDKSASGKIYAYENDFAIARPYEKRMKRLVDSVVSLLLIICFPLNIFIIKKPIAAFVFACKVLMGKRTWVGYANANSKQSLPPILPNKLTVLGLAEKASQHISTQALQQLNMRYAKHYEFWVDIKIIFKNYSRLGG